MQIIIPGNEKKPKKAAVVTVGTFDGVHRGHRFLLHTLNDMAQSLQCQSVAVTFALSPYEYFHDDATGYLLTTPSERLWLMETTGVDTSLVLNFNDEIMAMDTMAFLNYLSRYVEVRGVLLGFNNSWKERNDETARILRGMGVEVAIAREVNGGQPSISSTNIRSALLEGDLTRATSMLGRPYCLTGTITKGRGIGRTISYPTANVDIDDSRKLIPCNGVYAGEATLPSYGNSPFKALINIGVNPTVSTQGRRSIEAHILGIGHNKNLYGESITLRFNKYLRAEKKFDSIESLKRAIDNDLSELEKLQQA